MPALALFLIGGAKSIFGAVASWLSRRSLVELALMALAIFATVQHFQLVDARSDASRWHKQFVTDRASYQRAQAEADAKNKADVRSKEEQYKRNNDEAVSSLNDRIARLRRELSARSGAAPGSAGGSSLPQADHSPGAAGQAGVCLAPEELLRGAENEERYDQLITLILKQTR